MAIYIFDVFLTGFLSLFAIKELDESGLETEQSKKRRILCWSLILLTWVLIFSFRGLTGADTSSYFNSYKRAYNYQTPFFELISNYRDKLHITVVYICSHLSKGSWIFYGLVSGLICYVPIIILIAKKSIDYNTSCLVYLLSISAFYSYNGLKQALACGFIMCAYYFGLREKKYFRYAFLMLIAYGFHAASLLVIPFHLISLKKLKAISTKLILFAFVVLSFFLNNIWTDVLDFFGEDGVVSKYTDMFNNAHGSGVLRVLVWLSPLVICYAIYPNLKKKHNDVDHDILMVFFGAVFMVYSMMNANFSQMAYFFSVSNVILYPKIIDSINPNYKKIFKYTIILLFFLYFVILLFNNESGISPYISVWESKSF